jgi:hypothetical protein
MEKDRDQWAELKDRLGIGRQRFWEGNIEEFAKEALEKPKPIREQNDNVTVVADGVRGSTQELLKNWLRAIMDTIIMQMPVAFSQTASRVQEYPGLVVSAHIEGVQLDVIPTTTEIRLEMTPGTLREITAYVQFEDGTYDPRDYKNDTETFMIDWTSPVEDLVGLIVRYLHTRRKGVGP